MSVRQPCHHGWCSAPVLLGLPVALPRDRRAQFYGQALMRSHKVIVAAPPLQVFYQLRRVLGRAPGAPRQFRDTLPDGQIHPFAKGSVDAPTQPRCLQPRPILLFLAASHAPLHFHNPILTAMFDDLAIDELTQ